MRSRPRPVCGVLAAALAAACAPGKAAGSGCSSRFRPPSDPPLHATDLNGIALPDACFYEDGPHHVFVIGDWGGIISGNSSLPVPADHRSRAFPAHAREFIAGVDDSAQLLVAAQMRARARRSRPGYVINVGDNFYWGGIRAKCGTPPFKHVDTGQWGPIFEAVYHGLEIDRKQWLGVLGNHDYGGYMFTMAWDQAIGYTWGGPSSTGRWVTPAQYWSVKVHYPFFSIDYFFMDTNIFDVFKPNEHTAHNICGLAHNSKQASCGPQGPKSVWACPQWFSELWVAQVSWLQDRLLMSNADWQVVVTHFPPEYGKDDWKYLSQYGIDLIIAGHRHFQKVVPVGAKENFLNETAWIISGGGGGITSESRPSLYGDDDQYGFMDLTMSKDDIRVEAISHGGRVRSTTRVRPRPLDKRFWPEREARFRDLGMLRAREREEHGGGGEGGKHLV